MPRLALIHLGVHENIKKIPRLVGVPHLQSLTLAWMFHLHHLPALDLVPDLTTLVISVLPFLEWVPDMTPLRKLVDFTIMPGVICCNGFINACNLGDFLCQGSPIFGIPPATCLVNDTDWNLPVTPFLGSAETREAFKKFAPGICSRWAPGAIYIDNTPTKEKIEMCAGKPFRECHLPGNVTGICYNLRFQVLSCINDDTRITLRRYQIEKGVGAACDPIEEKWLGCEYIANTLKQTVQNYQHNKRKGLTSTEKTMFTATIRSCGSTSGHGLMETLAREEGTKVTRILPIDHAPKRNKTLVNHGKQNKRFQTGPPYHTLGGIGFAMLLVLMLCCVWTIWLIFVIMAPNEAANWLMDTSAYDNGQFWLIIDSHPGLARAGVVGLVIVDCALSW
ncbi:unnamed protein product [Phytophthora lilii]|uniref:Unnamed protein product n=1 Tax=Phytophthora lilii TaxID=2077276 RepID=A0A9W6TCH0_9STRA|nr:unnamed protein product [Phytophthora lilii]